MERLDEHSFEQITECYYNLFDTLIDKEKFYEIKKQVEFIYIEYITKIDEKYKIKGGTFGRGETKWGRNIIWGWYIEKIFVEVLKNCSNIKKIELRGGDSSHQFQYNPQNKSIEIIGKKNTDPDFLLTDIKENKFCIELKTAAKSKYTIKKTNVESLYKEAAYNGIITLILMIDLNEGKYSIQNVKYFDKLNPVINQSMEGQLCYDFPTPVKKLDKILYEDWQQYLDREIFNIFYVKKFKALKQAENIKDKHLIKVIKDRIRLDKYEQEKEVKNLYYDNEIKKIKDKNPMILENDWEKIFEKLDV